MVCDVDCLRCQFDDCVLESTTSQLLYNHSEKGRQARERYEQSEKGKLTRHVYDSSELGKERRKRYYESHKEQKKEYDRQRYLKNKGN